MSKPSTSDAEARFDKDSNAIDVKPKNNAFRLDPAFPVTAISLFTNFTLGNMIVYGITARWRLAYFCGMLTFPPTLMICLRDAQKDFENWEKSQYYRERNYPTNLIPHKVRYDWTDYENVIQAHRERKVANELAESDREYERERQ